MSTKEFICINCPIGCDLRVSIINNSIFVSGNNCINGEKYGISEVTNPTRVVTSIVKTNKGNYVSCKTDRPIPKDRIFDVISEIKKMTVNEPIYIKDILIKNVCGLDANIIATKNI